MELVNTCLGVQGALIHKKDRNGDPPLLCAVLAGSREVIRLLVKVRGAEVARETLLCRRVRIWISPPHSWGRG